MSGNKRKKKNNNPMSVSRVLFLIMILLIVTLFKEVNISFGLGEGGEVNSPSRIQDGAKTSDSLLQVDNQDNVLRIYFMDVGQADSILIQSGDEYMVIDGGNNNDGKLLVRYFQSLGVTQFKYVVGTHPHEDHIGGLDDIIENFEIDTIYLPDVITTTKTFEDLLTAMENKGKSYEVPKIDDSFQLGNATFRVIYTGSDTKDLNNSSIVLKLTFYDTSFLFTGDMTSSVENKILKKDIQVDVLKVGHHGSKYSSSINFLKTVHPTYAIISVGANNKYGHPAKETVSKLENLGTKVHRTDKEGTILIESDGKNITISGIKTNTDGG